VAVPRWAPLVSPDRRARRPPLGFPVLLGPVRHRRHLPGRDRPRLAAQWDPTRNGDLTPAAVRPASNKKVWWRCPAGHRWQAQINQRSRQHTGCPDCAARHRTPVRYRTPGPAS